MKFIPAKTDTKKLAKENAEKRAALRKDINAKTLTKIKKLANQYEHGKETSEQLAKKAKKAEEGPAVKQWVAAKIMKHVVNKIHHAAEAVFKTMFSP